MESRCYQKKSVLILAISAIVFCMFVIAPKAWASYGHDLNLSVSNQMVVRTGAYRTNRTIGNTISSKMGPSAMSIVATGTNQGFKSAYVPALFDSGQPTEAFTASTDFEADSRNSLTGLSSGGEAASHGLWVSASASALDNTFISTEYDGGLFLGMIGYDYRINKRLLLGAALGYESTDIDTRFNNGTVQSNAFTVSPYAAFRICDYLSIDVILSYSFLDYDTTRPTFLGQATGGYDADRYMVSSNLNYYYLTGNWNFNARFGYMYTKEDADGFTESNLNRVQSEDTKIGEFQIGGKIGYFINKFELFIGAYYIYDNTMTKTKVLVGQRRPSNDKSEVEAIAGINLFANDTVNLSAEVSTSMGRDDVDNTSVLVNVSFAF
jgi:outer membrane autotransporter protein